MTVRLATPEDVPWLVETAAAAYAGLEEGFDKHCTALWVAACVVDPDTVVVRGDHTAGFAQIVRPPWAPTVPVMDLIHLYSEPSSPTPWEPCHVVSVLHETSKARGCARMFVGSIYADLEPLAKRLGGRRLGSLYALES